MVSHGDQVEHISGLEPDVSMGDGLTLDESSRIEYLAYNVSKGKVRHLSNIIQSLLSLEKKIRAYELPHKVGET
ncbi:hypothetical protein V6N12_010476 [Hibiscus sabdariffa]